MPTCYFCDKNDRSYFSYYCDDCALLRRLLIVYEPTKAIEILKRTLIRDQSQINNKIENIVKENLPVIKETNDDTDEEPEVEHKKDLVLRNKKKIIKTFIP
tara:strand:- start:337 stop:639 length:303 start_codon:yes stop_codon:yes gene_type:complete